MAKPRAHPHRSVGAGVEALAGLRVRELGAADVHRVRALAHDDRVVRHPFADVAERPVVVHRHRVVVQHGGDGGLVLGRALREGGAPRGVVRVEPLAALERLVELGDDRPPVTRQRHLGRHVGPDLLRMEVELDHPHVLGEARREPEVHDPVEPRPHQEHHVGFPEGEAARRPDREGVAVVITPLPIGEARKGRRVRSMNARTSSSARDQAMPLPMMTRGRSADSSASRAASTDSAAAWKRGGSGTVAAGDTSPSSISSRMTLSGKSR